MTLEELTSIVEAMQVELQRLAAMVQTLSESHDLNRRELNTASARATKLGDDLDQQMGRAEGLLDEAARLKAEADTFTKTVTALDRAVRAELERAVLAKVEPR